MQLEQIASTYPTRERFLTELTLDPPDATSDEAGVPLLDEDYLILSTIHSAKGQEWRSVFVLNAVDGCIPSDLGTGSTAEIEEERRLLYVAMTRAKDHLHLILPQRFYAHAAARQRRSPRVRGAHAFHPGRHHRSLRELRLAASGGRHRRGRKGATRARRYHREVAADVELVAGFMSATFERAPTTPAVGSANSRRVQLTILAARHANWTIVDMATSMVTARATFSGAPQQPRDGCDLVHERRADFLVCEILGVVGTDWTIQGVNAD